MTRRDEDGVTLVVVALSLVALLTMVAIVIDLSQLRQDRQSNKRLADTAASAGALDLQAGPWRAVCTAYEYAVANARDFSSFGSETWSDQATTPTVYAATSGSCPGGVPYTAPCTADPATWAHFHGTAQGDNITIDIESGYTLPDPAFSQDATISGDDGQPCDQVAVIATQRRTPVFGGVVNGASKTTTIRSVARITRGPSQVAALVVLEQTDCKAIDASTNGGKLEVNAARDTPGVISVDSDGSTSCSGGQKVVQGSALPGGGPNILADPTSSSPTRSGRISIVALGTNPGAASTQSCPYTTPYAATCTITPVPVRGARLGRTFLDQRYLPAVRSAVGSAATRVSSMPGSYTALSSLPGISKSHGANPTCTLTGTVTVPATVSNVYVDCALSVQSGTTLEFAASSSIIVAQSTISVSGSNGGQGPGSLIVDNPGQLDVVGSTQGSSPVAINVSGNFRMGDGGGPATGCPTPSPGNPTSTMVVQNGQLSVGGGSTSVLRLCQTAVLMASGWSQTGSPPTAWPSIAGAAPYDNQFTGQVSIGGQGSVTWSAPNAVPNAPAGPNDWAKLEDLTLWTETSGGSSIAGQGGVSLAGVFALPNSNPFTISGTGSQTINADAQFWTRKLTLSGQAILEMAPNPNDSIPTLDFALVR